MHVGRPAGVGDGLALLDVAEALGRMEGAMPKVTRRAGAASTSAAA
jgi:hypothetical protein